MTISTHTDWAQVERRACEFERSQTMTPELAVKLLQKHKRDRFLWAYAMRAIEYIGKGWTVLACEECKSGHFVAAHDGDKTFLPVRVWLEDLIEQKAKP